MTSGTFQSFPISDITVADRDRSDFGDVSALADSIRRLGLIHPVVITREGILVAGERRLRACGQLGWTLIPVQFQDELSQITLKAIELEENVKRKDLTWQEEVKAVQAYHGYRSAVEDSWSVEQTADALGVHKNYVSQRISVAKAMAVNPAVAAAPIFSTARGLAERASSRAMAAEAASIVERPAPAQLVEVGNFNEWAPAYSGPRFNLIHCDFPYGINANKMQQGSTPAEFGDYRDTPEDYFRLLITLCENLERIAQPQAHVVFWLSMNFYTETLERLESDTQLKVNPFPLVWVKSDGSGLLPDTERGPRRVYETALLCSLGDRKIVRATANAFVGAPSREIHMSEKPQDMLEHFFKMLVDGSTSLLDPTAGSGSALRAARALGAQRVLGLEMNEEFAKRANEKLAAPEDSADERR